MRFYGFGNYYLSSLQQGLQSAHTVGELFVKYDSHSEQNAMVFDWAKNHKTMVLLNGGNSSDLHSLFEFLSDPQNPYPFVKFHEDESSLNGALTYVGMILPSRIYDVAAAIRNRKEHYFDPIMRKLTINDLDGNYVMLNFTQYEYNLCERLNMYGLAK